MKNMVRMTMIQHKEKLKLQRRLPTAAVPISLSALRQTARNNNDSNKIVGLPVMTLTTMKTMMSTTALLQAT